MLVAGASLVSIAADNVCIQHAIKVYGDVLILEKDSYGEEVNRTAIGSLRATIRAVRQGYPTSYWKRLLRSIAQTRLTPSTRCVAMP